MKIGGFLLERISGLSVCSEIMSERGYECSHIETDSYTEELEESINEFHT